MAIKIIGVAGASGSGKSTFSEELRKLLPDCYYLPADKHFKKELPKIVSPMDGQEYPDWNHPSSLQLDTLLAELEEAAKIHDYIIVDGVTIYCIPELLRRFDLKIYIDATIEMRFFRRISRNMQKGQTLEFIAGYYLNCARFREKEFSLPSRREADLMIDNEKGFGNAVENAAKEILQR